MTAPEVPHADLIAEARQAAEAWGPIGSTGPLFAALADALAALGDTVPASTLGKVVTSYEEALREVWTERAEARAERDALAHVREQVRRWKMARQAGAGGSYAALTAILDTAPAVSLALHDAEVKAQALDEAREAISTKPAMLALPERFLAARAAAIREDTIKEDK